MDPVVILLVVVVSIITTLLVVVGVHIIQILREVKKTVLKTNTTLETINGIFGNFKNPFHDRGGMVEGLKTGLYLAQAFAHWLTTNHPGSTSDE